MSVYFDQDDRVTSASHFDFDAIDEHLGFSEPEESNHENGYQDAARVMLRKFDTLVEVLLEKYPDQVTLWGLAFSYGATCLQGRSMTEIANGLDVTRAAVSKEANLWSQRVNLPPSTYMTPGRARNKGVIMPKVAPRMSLFEFAGVECNQGGTPSKESLQKPVA